MHARPRWPRAYLVPVSCSLARRRPGGLGLGRRRVCGWGFGEMRLARVTVRRGNLSHAHTIRTLQPGSSCRSVKRQPGHARRSVRRRRTRRLA